jgi:hypothetical protein
MYLDPSMPAKTSRVGRGIARQGSTAAEKYRRNHRHFRPELPPIFA